MFGLDNGIISKRNIELYVPELVIYFITGSHSVMSTNNGMNKRR